MNKRQRKNAVELPSAVPPMIKDWPDTPQEKPPEMPELEERQRERSRKARREKAEWYRQNPPVVVQPLV